MTCLLVETTKSKVRKEINMVLQSYIGELMTNSMYLLLEMEVCNVLDKVSGYYSASVNTTNITIPNSRHLRTTLQATVDYEIFDPHTKLTHAVSDKIILGGEQADDPLTAFNRAMSVIST